MILFIKNIFSFCIVYIVIIGFLLTSYNLYLDPYGVFSKNMNKQVTEPNQNLIKTRYILKNIEKHNAFLFGNSRVGKINVQNLSGNYNFYNMTYSEGVPLEHLNNIKLFLKSGVEIDRVIVCLDEISCFIDPESHLDQPLRKAYINKYNPLLSYLYLKPSIGIIKRNLTVNKDKFYTEGFYNGIYENGSRGFMPNKKDVYINQNIKSHINDSIFESAYWTDNNSSKNVAKSIEAIKSIISICNYNNISLTFFINPINIKTYKKACENGFLDFLEKLHLITDFYDFSGLNEITTNNFNYYETSHYRPLVGEIIVNELNQKDSQYFISNNESSSYKQSKQSEFFSN